MKKKLLTVVLAAAVVGAAALAFVLLGGRSGRDVTFFLTSDTHYGLSPAAEKADGSTVEAMNRLPGTDFPREIGGRVEVPRGVAVLGDLVNNSAGPEGQAAWRRFT